MLFAALILGSAVVFVAHGYRYEIGTGYLAKTADPTVSYEDYSKMTKKRDRTAAFAKETTYNKSLLWKQHFAYYEVKLDLNHRQKEFLRRVSAFLEESFFTHPINMSEAEYLKTTRGKPFKDLMQNVSDLFTPEQSRQLFLTIGDTSAITDWGCGASYAPVLEPEGGEDHGPKYSEPNAANNAVAFVGCTCTASICGTGCSTGTTCKIGFPSPICEAGGECGCFGWFDCTGLCFQDGIIE